MNCLRSLFLLLTGLFIGLSQVSAQSTDQRYPTAITTDTISGSISARAIGDSRKTEYFYAFEGKQGDIFINVVYENLNGDIDVFVVDGLRLMTRIVALADHGVTETGRVVYLRKPEKLLLRVSGRTPDDDPARFTIKFAGSFLAVSEDDYKNAPELPKVSIPAAVPERTAETAENAETPTEPKLEVVVEESVPAKTDERSAATPEREVSVDKPTEDEKPARPTPPQRRSTASRQRRAASAPTRTEPQPKPETEVAQPEPPPPPKEEPPAEQKLVVVFRDGARVDVSMNDVLRFSMDSGMLVIVQKNGRIRRFQMKDISKFSVE